MSYYAHATIEDGDARYDRGDVVPDDLSSLDDLLDSGVVSEDPYDPEQEPPLPPPEYVEIGGVRYVQSTDGAKAGDERV